MTLRKRLSSSVSWARDECRPLPLWATFIVLAARMGFLPTGVDYEPRALVRAQASAHQAGLGGRVRWVAADVFALPLAPGSFDVVVDYSAFHSPRPAPRTIRRHEMRPRTPATAGRLFHSPPAASL